MLLGQTAWLFYFPGANAQAKKDFAQIYRLNN